MTSNPSINRHIGDILGAGPIMMKKHLECLHARLGAEARPSVAAMAPRRFCQLDAQFEG